MKLCIVVVLLLLCTSCVYSGEAENNREFSISFSQGIIFKDTVAKVPETKATRIEKLELSQPVVDWIFNNDKETISDDGIDTP